MMKNYKLTLQYDGTRYSGWQKQGNTDNTIQAKLEAIAARLTHVPTDVNGSGRTDAGVHALGQIANFKWKNPSPEWSCEEICAFFNKALPMDIRVIQVEETSERFHARLNAASKHYRYILDNQNVPDVFERRYAARIPADPSPRVTYDIDAMNRAALLLLGEHDFKSFCDNKHMKKSTVRTIENITITHNDGMLLFDFYGNGFLYHMVRILTGTLLEIGNGSRQPEDIPAILAAKSRQKAGFTAPAQGLFLVEVSY